MADLVQGRAMAHHFSGVLDLNCLSFFQEWAGERDGRAMKLEARIKDLAMKNMELEARIKELEAETKRNEKEKRAIVKMQKQREQFREKIFCFGALLYVSLFAILITVIVSK